MQTLIVLYSALSVFGIGVMLVDLLGFLDHIGPASGGGHAAGNDSGHGADHGHDTDHQSDANHQHSTELQAHAGSHVSSGEGAARVLSRTVTVIRTAVYFSLGAGPTGLFATLTGVSGFSGLLWALGAGVAIALVARVLRTFMQRDLDSTIKPEELLMDLGVVSIPLMPGAMGKIIVRRFDHEMELFARAKDPTQSLLKGTRVRIVDFNEDCYWVESEVLL